MAEVLYKLQEWLTVPDAAAHLSAAFDEHQVTEADVYRLGLDGHLTLSVNFVNAAHGRIGKLVPREQIEVRGTPELGMTARPLTGNHYISETEVLQLDQPEAIATISGIWDLAMIGNEREHVRRRFLSLTGAPSVTGLSAYGAFVNQPDGTWCRLIEVPVPMRNELCLLGSATVSSWCALPLWMT